MFHQPTYRKIAGLAASLLIGLVGCSPMDVATSGISTLNANPVQAFAVENDIKQMLLDVHQSSFAEADRNHNGYLEPAELPEYSPTTFRSLDRTRDGRLALDEVMPPGDYLSEHLKRLRQEWQNLFKQLDSDQDQRISWSDMANNPGLSIFSDKKVLLTQILSKDASATDQRISYPIFEKWLAATIRSASQEKSTVTTVPRGTLPILLVPGYGEPSWYFMYGIYRTLKRDGFAVEGINLFPNFAPAEEVAVKVKAKAEAMMTQYRTSQIDIVAHSFGGLITRHWIQNMGGTQTIRNLITIATPHKGTYMAYAGPGHSAVQLRPDSDFIQSLNKNGLIFAPVKYTSIWSNIDEIVVPQKSAVLEGSTVHYVPWTGHLTIMFSDRTYKHIKDTLKSSGI